VVLDGKRLLALKDVCDRLACTRWTVRKLVKEGTFPPPIYVFGRPRWQPAAVEAHLAALERRANHAAS
jgi:predicted DNA-binding transcriptional regulator AlpA